MFASVQEHFEKNFERTASKRGLPKKVDISTWPCGRVAVWPKLILADVYQCLRWWQQRQGQNPQK